MGWALQEKVGRMGKLLAKAFQEWQGILDETSVGGEAAPKQRPGPGGAHC